MEVKTFRRICKNCEQAFETNRKKKVYCSPKCCNKAWVKAHPRAKTIVGALLLLLATSYAKAEERFDGRVDVVTPTLVYGGGNLADYLTTRAAIARGGMEGNPIVRKTGLTGAKLASTTALIGVDVMLQKRARKLVWPVRIIVGIGFTWVAKHNHDTARD